MRYVVTKMQMGQQVTIAAFVCRWQAERYAERESGMSGFDYIVEDLFLGKSRLSYYQDGKEVA